MSVPQGSDDDPPVGLKTPTFSVFLYGREKIGRGGKARSLPLKKVMSYQIMALPLNSILSRCNRIALQDSRTRNVEVGGAQFSPQQRAIKVPNFH